MTPYAILSDIHFHSWSAFSSQNEHGLNTRLLLLTDEVRRIAGELKKAGGNVIYLAGDIFHVRGNIAPSVQNPVVDMFKALIDDGFVIRAIPGNHDLEAKYASRMLSAVTALEGIGMQVCNETTAFAHFIGRDVMMMPWHEDLNELRKKLVEIDPKERKGFDLILHAPLDGVLASISAHGLDPMWLSSLGFRNVFAGHYHHHKEAAPNVWSIGALAHHSWSDTGTKAGYLIVDEFVHWKKSHLPEFIDIHKDMPKDEAELMAEGNYVRAKTGTLTMKEVQDLRDWLTGAGAKGVIIQSVKEATKTRAESTVKAGESLRHSTGAFIEKLDTTADKALLQKLCADILLEAGSV